MANKPTAQSQKDKGQISAFRKAARELGCDENEDRFRDALRTVAKHNPSSKTRKDQSSKSSRG